MWQTFRKELLPRLTIGSLCIMSIYCFNSFLFWFRGQKGPNFLALEKIIYIDNIYIRFGSKLYRQNVGIPMGTNCAPLVADLFLFCYERDFMKSLTKEKRYDLSIYMLYAFNSTSRYLDDLLNIDNIHFEHMVHRIYPAELQLNKADASDTEVAFLDLNLSIQNDIVSTNIYNKRDDFNFDIVYFPFP